MKVLGSASISREVQTEWPPQHLASQSGGACALSPESMHFPSQGLILDMVSDSLLSCPESSGFVIDGFPRELEQAKEFERIVSVPTPQCPRCACPRGGSRLSPLRPTPLLLLKPERMMPEGLRLGDLLSFSSRSLGCSQTHNSDRLTLKS